MQAKHILLLGANGQVGRAWQQLGKMHDLNITALSRSEVDLADSEKLMAALGKFQPELLVNAAAYTAVDMAEDEPEQAMQINAYAVAQLAEFAKQRDISLIHYSTDYVFDGFGDAPRDESAPTAPLNHYGKSKLAGEHAIAESGCKHLIFRTSWVYDEAGKNFLNTMLRLAANHRSLRVVADQQGAPTYAPDLAEASIRIAGQAMQMKAFPSGIYHLCHGGVTSWHGFAEAIFAAARAQGATLAVEEVLPIRSDEYPTRAVRPFNSRLSTAKAQQTFGVSLPDWQDGLAACMKEKERMADHAPA